MRILGLIGETTEYDKKETLEEKIYPIPQVILDIQEEKERGRIYKE